MSTLGINRRGGCLQNVVTVSVADLSSQPTTERSESRAPYFGKTNLLMVSPIGLNYLPRLFLS